ncbi:MFS transporter [Microvirga sp. W0021]|uniref:MFS transporter n=1 Tax=Hohaiivirga grylli TaxID=3133970 RepID=A0ABV0BG58_9HYPH
MRSEEQSLMPPSARLTETVTLSILIAISLSHLMNDVVQSLIPSMYPLIKDSLHLSFRQIGLIQLVFQLTASILQPVVGIYTDKKPQPFSLAVGMGLSLIGILLLSHATSYTQILVAVAFVGMGSSIFHPEASRVARMASGGRHGMAQSVFQVGGYAGSAFGPLLAALFIIPYGQSSLLWFSLVAVVAIGVLAWIGMWMRDQRKASKKTGLKSVEPPVGISSLRIKIILSILVLLVFSKAFYMASMSSYFTFYLKETFHVSNSEALHYLFYFLGAVAVGTLVGGPIGDRIGRKAVIWFSILGALPFTLMLPYANLFWTGLLAIVIGLIISSAFSSIVVYAQELNPGKVGMIAGLFFGLSFGVGGLGAAVLGELADHTSISFVYHICSYLPAIGLLTVFLPGRKSVRG